MGLRLERFYIDSNVVIDFIEKQDPNLMILFAKAEAGDVGLVTSELTLAEVLVQPFQRSEHWRVDIFETFLADRKLIEALPIDRSILRMSAELRATVGGTTPDSIHVATALAADCTAIVSSDRRMKLPPPLHRLSPTDLQDRFRVSS